MNTIAAADDSGPLHCTVCGRGSAWRAAFTPIKDGTVKRLCCPVCTERLQNKWARIAMYLMPIALVLMLSTHSRQTRDPIHLLGLTYCLFFVSQWVLVVLHELGHASVARLLGAPAYAISIGSKSWFIDRFIGAMRWRVGLRVTGGLTFHSLSEGPNERRNSILIAAAGPATNLLLAAVAIGVALSMPGRWSVDPAKLALLVFGGTSVFQFLFNAWPRVAASDVGPVPTDGARVLALWRGHVDDPRAARCGQHFMQAHFAYADGDYVHAADEARRAQEQCDHPEMSTMLTLVRGASLYEADQVDAGLAMLQSLNERPIEHPALRAAAEDNLAWGYFLVDEPTTRERALLLVERARLIAPWDVSFAIAQACMLAASAMPGNGRAEQARDVLASIGPVKTGRQNRAYAALARGLIAAATGDVAAARREYDDAKSRGATAAPLRVLERRLASG